MPIALPLPRFAFEALNPDWLYHLTRIDNLNGMVTAVTGQAGEWTDCMVNLVGTSGFGAAGRLLRDYSVVDFEFALSGRGTYTYFFCGEPSRWGKIKNFEIFGTKPLEDYRIGAVRVRPADLLARYQGPLFYRVDDSALVIRGSYQGPAGVKPLPMGAPARGG